MATIIANRPMAGFPSETSGAGVRSRASFLVPIGRVLYSLIFILSGLSHFSSQTVAYAASQGVPMATLLVPLSGAMIVIAGLMMILGYRVQLAAVLFIVFLIPTTLMMHNFWSVSDASMAQMQRIHFLKNLGLLGAALMFFYFGAGPYSLDERSHSRSDV